MRTISTLSAEPHRMPLKQQVLYKWIMPQLKEARYAVERATGSAIDIDTSSERNNLMYESAEPLARLYSPLFEMDDTFVLQPDEAGLARANAGLTKFCHFYRHRFQGGAKAQRPWQWAAPPRSKRPAVLWMGSQFAQPQSSMFCSMFWASSSTTRCRWSRCWPACAAGCATERGAW